MGSAGAPKQREAEELTLFATPRRRDTPATTSKSGTGQYCKGGDEGGGSVRWWEGRECWTSRTTRHMCALMRFKKIMGARPGAGDAINVDRVSTRLEYRPLSRQLTSSSRVSVCLCRSLSSEQHCNACIRVGPVWYSMADAELDISHWARIVKLLKVNGMVFARVSQSD